MKFPKTLLIDKFDAGKFINDNIVRHARWSVIHEAVFEHEGHFYETGYSKGAQVGTKWGQACVCSPPNMMWRVGAARRVET